MIFNKNNVYYLIIIVLVIILLLQRSCNGNTYVNSGKTTVKIDTVYKTIKDTIFKDVKVVYTKYVTVDKISYTPGNNIDTCTARFNNLLKEHFNKSTYIDTLKLDSLGTIVVIDTVWRNQLYGKRKYIEDIKIPYITKTITKPEQPKRQLYIGGNLFGNSNSFQSITPGLLYKNKKDQIYQANIGINVNGQITYGIGAYWKIKIK